MAELMNPLVMPKVIKYLSCVLEKVAEENDRNLSITDSEKDSIFYGVEKPEITIQSYFQRIYQYSYCSPSCFIVAVVYLDRIAERHPFLRINSSNAHRLLITSVMLAAKFMDNDLMSRYLNNAYYARVGGVSKIEMNILEMDFLLGVKFHLHVTPDTFYTFCSQLKRMMFMESPPLNLAESSLRSLNLHSQHDDDDDESTHQKQQTAV